MKSKILTKDIKEFLENIVFINVGTSDFDSEPNVAPKLLLKVNDDYIYIIDYVIGKTWRNIKMNPKVSLSTVNMDTLIGYQMNGPVEIISEGTEYNSILEEYRRRQIQLSTKRIIEGMYREKRHESFETEFPERIVVFKVKVEEIIEIIPSGELKRRSLI